MFIENRYKSIYDALIESRRNLNRIKVSHDGLYSHHIMPRCLGGSDDPENLVLLTLKEHRVAHHLLVKFTSGEDQWKMKHAFSFFKPGVDLRDSPFTGWTKESHEKSVQTRKRKGSYKTGSENIFSSPEIIAMVKKRMTESNPMKDPKQKERMRKNNHRNRPIVTPAGTFESRAAALRHHGFKHWKVLYDLMAEHPDQYYWLHQ